MLQFSDFIKGGATSTQNLASIPDTDEVAFDVTVTGASLGDFVMVSCSIDAQNLQVTGNVRAADTVEVTVSNSTGGAIDLGSADFRVMVGSASVFDSVF